MKIIVGNTLQREVIVTLVMMPKPRPDRLVPEGTLRILVSANRETIDADTAHLGEHGEVVAEATVSPGEIFRRSVPDPAEILAGTEYALKDVVLHKRLTDTAGVKTCEVTILPREPIPPGFELGSN